MEIAVNGNRANVPVTSENCLVQQAEAVPAAEASSSSPSDNRVVRELTEKIREYVKNENIDLSFSTYGENNEKISVTVSNRDTGEVIREIPPEELQELSGKIEEMIGMFFDGLA
jgi:flagellar protein FlaG